MFVAIMVISAFAGVEAIIPEIAGGNTSSTGLNSPPVSPSSVSASSGGTVDVCYGVQVSFPTVTHDSSSTNTNTACKSTSSTSGYPAPDYPAYPSYPSYPSASSETWTLDLGSTQVASGSSSPYDSSNSQSQSQYYTHSEEDVDHTIYYVTYAYSQSHSTTSWENQISATCTFESYGSTGGTDNTWTVNIDGSTASGTLDIFAPSVSASVSTTSIDVGQSVSLGESISHGSGGYSYSWSSSGASGSFSSTTSSNPTWTASATGTVSFTVTVTQSGGYTYSATTSTVTISSDPTISISPSYNPSDSGEDITYDTSVSGGSGSYSSYSYVLYDGTSTSDSELTSGTTSSFSYTYDSTGSYLLVYSVTDSNGYTASTSLTQTVNPDTSISISSSQNPTDSGKTVEFMSSVSGGTSPYNYTWAIDGNNYYTKDVNYTFSASGSYTIALTVRDSADYSVDTSLSQTINSDPVVSASSNVSSADIGYPIAFSASPSGGTGPYTYSWALNGNVVSTAQDFSYSFSNSGSYTLTVTVTDAVGETYSSSVTVTINPNPSVSISSSQNPTDRGNSVQFSSSVSGGTGTDTYSWTINGEVVSTSSEFDYDFNSTGIYYVNVTVVDSDGHSGSYSLKETVNPDPSVSIRASHNPTDLGIEVNFTAVVTGGTNPDTYSWTINGDNYNTSSVDILFTSPGTYTVTLEITDANGNTASASYSEIVNPDPTVAINSEYNPVDQGVNDSLTAEVSGGTGPFNYTWTLGNEILNYSSSFHINFTATGTYTVNLTVVDSLGETAVNQVIIKVIQRPSAAIIGNNETDISTETYWEGYGSFGTAPYSYYWFINGVNTTSGLYLEYSFPDTGKYNITLLIIDSQGAKAYAYLNVTVNEKPSVSISVSKTTADAGIPVDISAEVSGGTGPFNYTISVSGIGIIGYSNSMYYEFSPGTYTVKVTVYDAEGNSASASISVVINGLPTVSIHSRYSNIDPNTTDVFNATISGGTSPYSLLWYINGTYSGNQTSISASFPSQGIFTVEVKVTDAESQVSSSIIDVNVVSYPESSIIVSHTKIDANVSDTFRAQGAGGVGPYSYQFIINGHAFDNSTVSYAFPDQGIYIVELTISDAFGHDATSYANITVYPDPVLKVLYNGTPTASEPFNMQANVTGGIAPYSVSWIFSDETLSGFNISHAFSSSGPNTFEVKVTDSSGYTLIKNYTVNVNLYVAITSNTTRGLGPLSVQFSSSVLGGSDYSFNWTFLPGHYSLQQNPLYTFPVGNYTVHFVVTSANGAKGYANISIFSLPPPVSISYSNNKNITQYFYFNATANWDSGANYNMTWSMPNGQNIQGMDIRYKFPVYSEFNTVIATFYYGNSTYTERISVEMVPAIPSITFTPPSKIATGTLLVLNATVTDPDSSSFTYVFDVNGTDYPGNDVQVLFENAGVYHVEVTVTDSLGASASVETNISVLKPGHSSTIAISITKTTSGPDIDFSVHVQSLVPVSYAQAYIGSSLVDMPLVRGNSTDGFYNVTVNQQDYSAGLYGLKVVVFTANGDSNSATEQFSVSSQYARSSFSIVAFFGGIDNLIMVILTIAGIVLTYVFARPKATDINIDGTTLVGRPGKPVTLKKSSKKRVRK